MQKSHFGARQEPPRLGQGEAGKLEIVSKIEFVRGVLAVLIRDYEMAPAGAKDSLFLRIRIVQDQVAALKHRKPALGQQPSSLAWTDRWCADPGSEDA